MATTHWHLHPPPERYAPSIGDTVFLRAKSAKERGKVGRVVRLQEVAAAAADAETPHVAETHASRSRSNVASNTMTSSGAAATDPIKALGKESSSDDGDANSDTSNNSEAASPSPSKKKRKRDEPRAIVHFHDGRELSCRPSRLVQVYSHKQSATSASTSKPIIVVTPDTTNYRILAASQVVAGDRVLEVGCSTGEATAILARYVSGPSESGSTTTTNNDDAANTGCVIALDTGESMIASTQQRIGTLDPHHRVVECHKINAFRDPKNAYKAATSDGTRPPDVVFIDIGGNRELYGVVRMVDWALDAFVHHPPRLIVIKSQELVAEMQMAARDGTAPVSLSDSGEVANGDNWFALKADMVRDETFGGSHASSGIDITAAKKGGPPKYAHPLKAPLALSPRDDMTPICRFHNYLDCKKGDECDFDHEHCHWCLQRGHVAQNCTGEGDMEDDTCASSSQHLKKALRYDFTSTTLKIVHCHAEGEVGDVIVSGFPYDIPGETLWDKSRFIARDGQLRDYVLQEPRGGVFRHVNLLVKPIHPDAKVAFIIMEPEDTPPMSGSNSICVATVCLETGIIPITAEDMRFTMEAPGGLVNVQAKCKNGKATQIKVTNVPSFAGLINAKLEVESIGKTLSVDTCYGGDSFVVVDSDDLGIEIAPENAKELVDIGMQITKAANEKMKFVHPTNKEMTHFSFTMIAKPIFQKNGVPISHTAVAIQPGKIDRCPTGTGCSARLALLYAKGILKLGDAMIGRSIIGSEFTCRIEEEMELPGGVKAIRPSIAGQGWISGTSELRLDKTDPYPRGYKLSDTWPKKLW